MNTKEKVIYGDVCHVILNWTEHQTPDGTDFCTLKRVRVGFDEFVDAPLLSSDDRSHWAKVCQSEVGLLHFWFMSNAITNDRNTLEKYLPCPDHNVINCQSCQGV